MAFYIMLIVFYGGRGHDRITDQRNTVSVSTISDSIVSDSTVSDSTVSDWDMPVSDSIVSDSISTVSYSISLVISDSISTVATRFDFSWICTNRNATPTSFVREARVVYSLFFADMI